MKSGLSALGFERPGNVLANLAAERLCEEIDVSAESTDWIIRVGPQHSNDTT